MYAPCEVEIIVKLCDEDIESEADHGKCGQLLKAMYGTRPMALSWQKEYTRRLVDAGLVPGKSSPCLLYSKERISGSSSVATILLE